MVDQYSIPLTQDEQRIISRLQDEDQAQRDAGLSSEERTRNVAASTGAFLWQMVMSHRPTSILEIGSSNGLSTMWMASAARHCGSSLLGTELIPERAGANNANLAGAHLDGVAMVATGDQRSLDAVQGQEWDFVFLDAEKDDYLSHLQAIEPHLRTGAVILADNVVSHDCHVLQDYLRSSSRYSTFTIPLDRGIEYAIFLGDA